MSRWEQEEAEQEEAEQKAYEKHMQAMYDEQHQMQQLAEEDAWIRAEVERLKAENEVLRGERPAVVAWLRRLSESSDESILVQVATYIEHGAHRDRREVKP